jgi:hypothetical protein
MRLCFHLTYRQKTEGIIKSTRKSLLIQVMVIFVKELTKDLMLKSAVVFMMMMMMIIS